jgi:hypothetical protein
MHFRIVNRENFRTSVFINVDCERIITSTNINQNGDHTNLGGYIGGEGSEKNM